MFRGFAAGLILLACWSVSAEAATFRLQGSTIYMTGPIVAADPLRLSRMIDLGARAIVLESPGGLVATGSYMADLIHAARLTTIVSGECASACTMMFYAGTRRKLTGRLGFHNATDAIGSARYAAQMKRYGAPREALRAAMTTPADRITWLR